MPRSSTPHPAAMAASLRHPVDSYSQMAAVFISPDRWPGCQMRGSPTSVQCSWPLLLACHGCQLIFGCEPELLCSRAGRPPSATFLKALPLDSLTLAVWLVCGSGARGCLVAEGGGRQSPERRFWGWMCVDRAALDGFATTVL
jgi:hypothetical protein